MSVVKLAKLASGIALLAFALFAGVLVVMVSAAWFDTQVVRPVIGYYPLVALAIRLGGLCLYLGLLGAVAFYLDGSARGLSAFGGSGRQSR